MKEVEDLIFTSKKMFKHIYENIITSDLIDAEVVSAVAKLMEGIHRNKLRYIYMYTFKYLLLFICPSIQKFNYHTLIIFCCKFISFLCSNRDGYMYISYNFFI